MEDDRSCLEGISELLEGVCDGLEGTNTSRRLAEDLTNGLCFTKDNLTWDLTHAEMGYHHTVSAVRYVWLAVRYVWLAVRGLQ